MIKDDEGWMMNEEWWWFQAVDGFLWLTDRQTDICECRVAFATEKTHGHQSLFLYHVLDWWHCFID